MADEKSPYPAPGSGETTKPQGGEPERLPDNTEATRALGVPAPKEGGPEPRGPQPSSSAGEPKQ